MTIGLKKAVVVHPLWSGDAQTACQVRSLVMVGIKNDTYPHVISPHDSDIRVCTPYIGRLFPSDDVSVESNRDIDLLQQNLSQIFVYFAGTTLFCSYPSRVVIRLRCL